MNRDTGNIAKGMMMGAAAVTAAAAGAYMAMENKREVKKAVKKAMRTAENTIGDMEKMVQRNMKF